MMSEVYVRIRFSRFVRKSLTIEDSGGIRRREAIDIPDNDAGNSRGPITRKAEGGCSVKPDERPFATAPGAPRSP